MLCRIEISDRKETFDGTKTSCRQWRMAKSFDDDQSAVSITTSQNAN